MTWLNLENCSAFRRFFEKPYKIRMNQRSCFTFQLQKAKEDAEEAYNTVSEVAKKEVSC